MARRAAGRGGALSRERIEEAAVALIDRDGLEGFTTRKLADALGCEAMSIYHYYPSKAHLLDALFDRILAALPPDDPSASWRVRLEAAAYAYRRMAHRHPRFMPFVVLHRHNTRAGMAWLERMLSIFRSAGLDTEQVARYFRVVSYYVVGAVIDETSGYAAGHSAVAPVSDDDAARDFPEVTAVNRFFQPPEHDATFRLGLDALVGAIEAEVSAAAKGDGAAGAGAPSGDPAALRSGARRATSSRSSSR